MELAKQPTQSKRRICGIHSPMLGVDSNNFNVLPYVLGAKYRNQTVTNHLPGICSLTFRNFQNIFPLFERNFSIINPKQRVIWIELKDSISQEEEIWSFFWLMCALIKIQQVAGKGNTLGILISLCNHCFYQISGYGK